MRVIDEKKLREKVYGKKAAEIKPLPPKKEQAAPKTTLNLDPLVESVDRGMKFNMVLLETMIELMDEIKSIKEKPAPVPPALPAVAGWDFTVMEHDHNGRLRKVRARKLIKKKD